MLPARENAPQAAAPISGMAASTPSSAIDSPGTQLDQALATSGRPSGRRRLPYHRARRSVTTIPPKYHAARRQHGRQRRERQPPVERHRRVSRARGPECAQQDGQPQRRVNQEQPRQRLGGEQRPAADRPVHREGPVIRPRLEDRLRDAERQARQRSHDVQDLADLDQGVRLVHHQPDVGPDEHDRSREGGPAGVLAQLLEEDGFHATPPAAAAAARTRRPDRRVRPPRSATDFDGPPM